MEGNAIFGSYSCCRQHLNTHTHTDSDNLKASQLTHLAAPLSLLLLLLLLLLTVVIFTVGGGLPLRGVADVCIRVVFSTALGGRLQVIVSCTTNLHTQWKITDGILTCIDY